MKKFEINSQNQFKELKLKTPKLKNGTENLNEELKTTPEISKRQKLLMEAGIQTWDDVCTKIEAQNQKPGRAANGGRELRFAKVEGTNWKWELTKPTHVSDNMGLQKESTRWEINDDPDIGYQSIEGHSEREYEVEEIRGKRFIDGKPEYLVKWLDYGDKFNSWNQLESLNCPALITDYERKVRDKQIEVQEFYEVEKILKKKIQDGEILYLIKFKNYDEDENEWILEANINCPVLIAEFEETK